MMDQNPYVLEILNEHQKILKKKRLKIYFIEKKKENIMKKFFYLLKNLELDLKKN